MLQSKASATWDGTLQTGSGTMKPDHAAAIQFTMGTRFEGAEGSNPEEVIGAALAGCFSMALSLGLEKAGATPVRIHTDAKVSLEKRDEGFTITAIHLDTEVEATGLDDATFQDVANTTKSTCPVSRALAAVENIALNARLISG
jgi:osmotically inducible protein OsmC